MKKNYFKLISSVLIAGIFLFVAFGSGEDENEEPAKFEFNSCRELIDYIGWSNSSQQTYSRLEDLQRRWEVNEVLISDLSTDGIIEPTIYVSIDKVKVNGSVPWFIFKATTTGKPRGYCIGASCEGLGKKPYIKYTGI